MKKILSFDAASVPQDYSDMSIADAIGILDGIIFAHKISADSDLGQALVRLRIQLQQIEINLSPFSQRSSIASTASLGESIADYDKAVLYTFRWTPRGDDNCWSRGNDFKSWILSGKKLPTPKSALNCWEAVMVVLYLYNALDKKEVQRDYDLLKADTTAAKRILGFDTPETFSVVKFGDLDSAVQPGDILAFKSNTSLEMAHVAIVLEKFEKLWLVSYWRYPREKILRITPDRLILASETTALSEYDEKIAEKEKRLDELFGYLRTLSSNESEAVLVQQFAKINDGNRFVRATDLRSADVESEKYRQLLSRTKDIFSELSDMFKRFKAEFFEAHSESASEHTPALGELIARISQLNEKAERFFSDPNELFNPFQRIDDSGEFVPCIYFNTLYLIYSLLDDVSNEHPFNVLIYAPEETLEKNDVLVSTKFRSHFAQLLSLMKKEQDKG